jgi:hypothetical protein
MTDESPDGGRSPSFHALPVAGSANFTVFILDCISARRLPLVIGVTEHLGVVRQ